MMKYVIAVLGLLALMGGYSYQAFATENKVEAIKEAVKNHAEKPFKEVSADELKKLQEEHKNLVIIDSRGGKYFDGTVIEGAINLPADETTAEALAEIASDKATPIVFYCTNTACHASELAAYKAAEAGYTTVFKYPEGIEEWVKKGYATAKIEAESDVAPAAGKAEDASSEAKH